MPPPSGPERRERQLKPAPHLGRRLDDQPELGRLRLALDVVAVHGAGEAALRRESQLIQGNELRGLVDAALEVVLSLQRSDLRAHDAEDDTLALGHEPERREIAGPLV